MRTPRSEEHTSELQSRRDLVCRLLLEKKKSLLTDSCQIERPEPQPCLPQCAVSAQLAADPACQGLGWIVDRKGVQVAVGEDFGDQRIVVLGDLGSPLRLFLEGGGPPRDQHSFPTRRSSD